jgi:RNA-directed DNA polymerase
MSEVRWRKVTGDKSPGACPERSRRDGHWPYWVERLGRDPTKPTRVIRLLKRQKNRCALCGLRFVVENIVEVHHQDGELTNNRYANLALLHGHCHDEIHGKGCL